jgi:hypothetical protein
MGSLLRAPNGNAVVLVPRSGSHSLCVAALASFWPDVPIVQDWHPAASLPNQEDYPVDALSAKAISIVVRNPIERFRSMCAHRPNRTIQEHLDIPVYGSLPKGNFVRYFRFEDQFQECADWLGITVLLEQIDPTEPSSKPNLTPEQEARVREIYADDIVLWESLR